MLLLTELPASWTSWAHRNGIRAADVPAVRLQNGAWLVL